MAANLYAAQKPIYDSQVGKTLFASDTLTACPRPNAVIDCWPIDRGGRFAVEAVVPPGPPGPDASGRSVRLGAPYCRLTSAGHTGFALCSDVVAKGVEFDPTAEEKECKRRGDPKIGMSYKQVEATCWGKPDHVNRTQSAAGISDQLVYGDGRYVYLRDGVVTSIQASGTLR